VSLELNESPVREDGGGLEFSSLLLTLCLLIGALSACPFILTIESYVLFAIIKIILSSLIYNHAKIIMITKYTKSTRKAPL